MAWIAQAVMEAVKALPSSKGCVRLAAIAKHTELTTRQVADACTKLVQHGYLSRDRYSDHSVKPGCYTLTPLGLAALQEGIKIKSGPTKARGVPQIKADSLRERAWRLLRIRRKVSVPELAGVLLDATATPAEVKSAQNNLQHYMRALKRAGYVAELRRGAPETKTSNGPKRYLLVRDTGLRPPVPQPSSSTVYDQNEGKQYDAK